MGAGLDSGAIRCPLKEQPNQAYGDNGKPRGKELVGREDQAAHEERSVESPWNSQTLLACTPDQPDQFLYDERRTECQKQTIERRLAVGRAQAEFQHHPD